jgi:hypothetical protein
MAIFPAKIMVAIGFHFDIKVSFICGRKKNVDVCMDRPKKLCYVYIVKDNCILPQIIVKTHETPCQGLRIFSLLLGQNFQKFSIFREGGGGGEGVRPLPPPHQDFRRWLYNSMYHLNH